MAYRRLSAAAMSDCWSVPSCGNRASPSLNDGLPPFFVIEVQGLGVQLGTNAGDALFHCPQFAGVVAG